MAAYFGLLLTIAWVTSKKSSSVDSYYLGNRASPWYAVAFGYVSDSLSGVTFISVPGQVATSKFSYLQVVLGNMVGYWVIAGFLLPLYYRLNLTSIYGYLGTRFGPYAQRTGSGFFIISRTLGSAARLFLAINVFQGFVFQSWGIRFEITAAFALILILAYTLKGGIGTLVWTDTLQSTFLLLGIGTTLVAISRALGLDGAGIIKLVSESPSSEVFEWDWRSPGFFWKQFLSGICLAVVMNGLDQNMMQKNLSCRSLKEAQWNLYLFSGVMVLVNVMFLSMGVLMHQFASNQGLVLPPRTDAIFPTLAMDHLGVLASVAFVFGLTAATFSSADSVLTSLTTSFCIDLLGMKNGELSGKNSDNPSLRYAIHVGFAVLLFITILIFRWVDRGAVVTAILKMAGYTYGPLLGLFTLGLITRRKLSDRYVPWICCASPLVCLFLEQKAPDWWNGYRFGFELILVNAAMTGFTLWLFSLKTAGNSSNGQIQNPLDCNKA